MNDDYRQGLLDAIAEIDAELECVEIEYADAPPCLRAARRVLTNAKQLILDKLAIETPNAQVTWHQQQERTNDDH